MDIRLSALHLAQDPPGHLIELARLREACGYKTFWYTDERFFRAVYSSLTLAAVHTQRIQLGATATNPYTRHPALTTMALATLDELAQGRAVLSSLRHRRARDTSPPQGTGRVCEVYT